MQRFNLSQPVYLHPIWSWQQSIIQVGKGKGNMCPNCGYRTLHYLLTLEGGNDIRLCNAYHHDWIETLK